MLHYVQKKAKERNVNLNSYASKPIFPKKNFFCRQNNALRLPKITHKSLHDPFDLQALSPTEFA